MKLHCSSPSILFEDQHLIILNKPAGLLSQGDHSNDPHIGTWLQLHFGRHYVGLVHRLDRNTSGLMVVAKRSKAARRLCEDLKDAKLQRTYLGWVEGELKRPQVLKHLMIKSKDRNVSKIENAVNYNSGKQRELAPESLSKMAITHLVPVKEIRTRNQQFTLVEFSLKTGRSHQIRAQSAQIGHPIVGDVKYGGRKSLVPRTLLHAVNLMLYHPISRQRLIFSSGLPKDFVDFENQCVFSELPR